MIGMLPAHRVTFWLVAGCKYLLQTKLSVGERLYFSEMLDGLCSDGNMTAEMIAAIQPAGRAELEMFDAACRADPPNDKSHGKASFDLLMSPRLFDLLTAANPSVLDAIKANVARVKARASVAAVPQPITATAAPLAEAPERYHIHSVPTETAGPASIYPASPRAGHDTGPPPRNDFDLFTGKSTGR